MLNIGGAELLVILLVGLVFLGPQRLPGVARQVGQTVSSLRSLAAGFQAELEAAARPEEIITTPDAMYDTSNLDYGEGDAAPAVDAEPAPTGQAALAKAARSVDVDGDAADADARAQRNPDAGVDPADMAGSRSDNDMGDGPDHIAALRDDDDLVQRAMGDEEE